MLNNIKKEKIKYHNLAQSKMVLVRIEYFLDYPYQATIRKFFDWF